MHGTRCLFTLIYYGAGNYSTFSFLTVQGIEQSNKNAKKQKNINSSTEHIHQAATSEQMAVSSPRVPSARIVKESFGTDLNHLVHGLSQLSGVRNHPGGAAFMDTFGAFPIILTKCWGLLTARNTSPELADQRAEPIYSGGLSRP